MKSNSIQAPTNPAPVRWARSAAHAALVASEVGIAAMLLLVVADVCCRAVFNLAIPGVDTVVAAYLMVATIFLPLAMLHALDENIVVDIVYGALPARAQAVLDVMAHLATLAFYGLLAWIYAQVSVESVTVREFVTGTWDVPIWPARLIMPLGASLGAGVAAVLLVHAAARACAPAAMRPARAGGAS